MTLSTRDGAVVLKDPDSVEVYTFDWGTDHLGEDAAISTSTFTVSGPDALLTADEDEILAGSRSTQIRLTGGTVGRRYRVTNRIVTNETPAQTKDASVDVLIQQR